MGCSSMVVKSKTKYLTPLAQGTKDGDLYIGAFMLSEPEAGSDATSQKLLQRIKESITY